MIRVQTLDFNVQQEYQALQEKGESGAIVFFCGLVRDFPSPQTEKDSDTVSINTPEFELQHYPGMTEKVLTRIEQHAHKKWRLIHSRIIHRVGKLNPGEQIVFVGVSSAHRRDAFSACEYIMDILKTEAPFWKKEGGHWVDAKASDRQAAKRWLDP